MTFEWTVKIGDVLTSVTILLSVIALLVSWAKDRALRTKAQADHVRKAAATTLAKLERWKTLSLSIYDELQLVFVETSELYAKEFDIVATRDYLWKTVCATRAAVLSRRLGENIENAYVELYGYHPAVRQLFLSTMDRLNATEEEVFLAFLSQSQKDVMVFEDRKKNYTTAMMGNALRQSAVVAQFKQDETLQAILQPINSFLADLVARSDRSILRQEVTNLTNHSSRTTLYRTEMTTSDTASPAHQSQNLDTETSPVYLSRSEMR